MFELDQNIEEIVAEIMNSDDEVIQPVEEIIVEDDVLVADREPIELPKFSVGNTVMLISGALSSTNGALPANLFNTKLYIRNVKDGNYGISTKMSGRALASVKAEYVTAYVANAEKVEAFIPYVVFIKGESLEIKSRPSVDSKTLSVAPSKGLFHVIGEKDGWCHLQIGGWLPLDSVRKI